MVVVGSRLLPLGLALCAACTSIAADQRTFEGTRWHVMAINSHATPASGDYHIEFKNGTVGGRFGCNSFGGAYTMAQDMLTVRNVNSTMMACPEPAMGFESAGLGILNAPLRIRWSGSRRLRLGNSVGSIDLERLP
jgi:heat shock protein HslJ